MHGLEVSVNLAFPCSQCRSDSALWRIMLRACAWVFKSECCHSGMYSPLDSSDTPVKASAALCSSCALDLSSRRWLRTC